MAQIHKQFTTEQIKVLLEAYNQGHLSRGEIEKTLGISKTRFFAIMKQYRTNPESFSIKYERKRHSKLDEKAEEEIQKELLRDKELIENKELPVYGYNYAALNDRLRKEGIQVSTTTIIKRAKMLGFYQAKKRRKSDHDREVITSATGDLIQHDASIHKWTPYAESKWTLITSLDDYSRMFLYADFVESETSWAHIQAVQYLMRNLGYLIGIMLIIYGCFALFSTEIVSGRILF